jgi:4-hydroxy-tetrahydrodipicolinate synthase
MQGSYVALVTPFNDDFSINEEKWIELIQRQVDGGTDGLLPCGTTGETPALNSREKHRIIQLAVENKGPGQTVMAGSGTNNTEKTIEETKKVADLGVDIALVITPYYNKPNQEGMVQHFAKVLDASPIPVMLYNVPGRTGVNILPATIDRLAGHEKLIAVKEASGNLMQISELVKLCGDRLNVLSGDDGITLPIMSTGARGVVSVSANIVPGKMKTLIHNALNNKFDEALKIHLELLKLHDKLFMESSPIPAKVAMNLMGLGVGPVRLPLGPASPATIATIKSVIEELGLI